MRQGSVIATFDLSRYDEQTSIGPIYVCPDFEAEGVSTTGPGLATPYELPGMSRCDPYVDACVNLFLTASRYGSVTKDEVILYADEPWMACRKDQPEGCKPDPDAALVRLLVSPDELADFVDKRGCGPHEDSACR